MKNNRFILSILFVFGVSLSSQAQTINLNAANHGQTFTTCNATIYDSGGPNANYGNNENYHITICGDGGANVILFFNQFNTEQGFDNMYIYDGPNIASPLIAQGSGTELQGQTIYSSGNCITIRFQTDGSVTFSGFQITATCAIPCQDFTIDMVSTDPPLSNVDSLWINLCQEDQVTFTVEGTYPNNNINYAQSDATTNWVWTIIHGNTTTEYSGVGLTSITHTFSEPGGYFIALTAYDTNSCYASLLDQYRVRVSVPPDFVEITIEPPVVCPGGEVTFSGGVESNSWIMPIAETQIVEECIDDILNVVQSFCWEISAFQPGQTITAGTQIEAVSLSLDHSYLGDLEIHLQCPNGQQANLLNYPNGCGSTYLGIPANPNGPYDCTPGIGWDYTWTNTAAQSVNNACGGFGTTLPEGEYLPQGSFNQLIGCPINGEWCVIIIDNLLADHGTLFMVDLQFHESIIPASVWEVTTEFDETEIIWLGEAIQPNYGGTATAFPVTSGDQTYVFQVTDDFGCTYETTATVHVLPYDHEDCCEKPDTYAGEDDHVCTNTYTFNADLQPGNTGTWAMISGPGNANFSSNTSPSATVTVDAWGVYMFTWTEQNISPACAVPDTVTIAFYPIPTTTFNYQPILCYSDTTVITYTGSASPAAQYNWDFDGGHQVMGFGPGPYSVFWTESGTHTVTLSITENGCTSPDTTVNIFNPAKLEYDLIVNNDPCYQHCAGSAQINVTGGTSPYSYSWQSGTPVLQNLCAGSYSVTVTDANGCTAGQSFNITQPLELVINNIITSNVQCHGRNDGVIIIDAIGGTQPLSYIWSDIGSGPAVRDDLYAGNYWVTVKDQNECNIVLSFIITQPDELQVYMSPSQYLCEGDPLSVSFHSFGGTTPYTYYWDQGQGYSIAGNTLNIFPSQTTTFSAYVLDGNNCISDTLSMTATVSPEMIIDSITTTNNRCHNSCDGKAIMAIQGGIPPLNYSWGSTNHIYENLCAGTYNVTVTDQIGCSVSGNFSIKQPYALVYTGETKPATCNGYDDGRIEIHVQGGTLPYSYLWPNGLTEPVLNGPAGNYTVTVTDANDCRMIVPFEITQPTKIITSNVWDRTICIGEKTTLSAHATGGTPYYDFKWTGSDGSVYPVSTPTVSPTENTTYTLVVTDSLGCKSDPKTLKVKLYPELKIVSAVTSYDTICEGEGAIIQVDVTGGNGGPYLMTLQDGTVVSSPFTVYPKQTTVYHMTIRDNCGTPAVKDSIKINVRPTPRNVVIANRVSGCPPFTVNFQETTNEAGRKYLWNFGDGSFSYEKYPSYTYNNPGSYDVTLEVQDHFGCVNRVKRNGFITVHRNPVALFIPKPDKVTEIFTEVHFVNKSSYADYNYWFFGDGDSSNHVSPRHTFNTIGEFDVMLVTETRNHCFDTAVKTIVVTQEFTFHAPTSFTPNGDGLNDCFRICGNGIDKNDFLLYVYDRWGNRVYETTKYNPEVGCDACGEGSWDGTFHGDRLTGDKVLSTGLYYWFCEFKDLYGNSYQKTGTVYLIR